MPVSRTDTLPFVSRKGTDVAPFPILKTRQQRMADDLFQSRLKIEVVQFHSTASDLHSGRKSWCPIVSTFSYN
jgi:hypothetical protein